LRKIGVLVVDDSALIRQTISTLLSEEEDIEIIGTASNPFKAAEIIAHRIPDVIILDIEMPGMDGLTFLQKIMSQHPLPVIICSSLTGDGSDTAMKALAYGANDIITKPKVGTKQFLYESKVRLIDSIKAAASAQHKLKKFLTLEAEPKYSADVVIPKKKTVLTETTDKVIVIGASTGGTEALKDILIELPPDIAGLVIVQHMPENFTRAFAERLNSLCSISVREAKNGDSVLRGLALIAPGNKHTLLRRSGANYYVEVKDGPLVTRHRPSVDVLFRSTAHAAGKNALGVIMTGMGDDGAKGMLEMKEAGAFNIAQDEETCVVFGMPNEAIKLNAVDLVLPLWQIPQVLYKMSKS
jgi:two-component system chemotaxis response regulator CheB